MSELKAVPAPGDPLPPARPDYAANLLRLKLVRAGIGKGRLDWTWESTPGAEARAALPELRAAYVAREDVVLAGGPGTGKTGLVIGAVRAALAEERTAQFVVLPLLLVDLNDCYREASKVSRGELLRELYGADSPDLLVVDDLGAELRETDAVKADVWLLLETRKANGKQTWITTNLDAGELEDRYDKRSFSRLTAYRLVVVEGKDLRRGER